jgi:hypothetical protein
MPSESENAGSQKRLRKGTRRCIECRRRKRRCIWPPDTEKCDSCATKGIRCLEQLHGDSRLFPSKTTTMRQRINELEGILDQILARQGNMYSSLNLSLSGLNIADAVKGHRVELNNSAVAATASHSGVLDLPRPLSSTHSTVLANGLANAPLLSLFDNAILGHNENDAFRDVHFEGSWGDLGVRERNTSPSRNLQSLALSPEIVTAIIRESRTPLCILGKIFLDMPGLGAYCLDGSQIALLRDHIVESFESDEIGTITRVLLCLAFCIQQLPANFNPGSTALPAPLDTLQNYYMETAEAFIAPGERVVSTMDGLECLVAQFRYYINLGIPRKAWVILRRAIAFAQLLHQRASDSQLNDRKISIWFHIWLSDKCVSLLLGLPYGMSSCPYEVVQGVPSEDSRDHFVFSLGMIARHVIDRNQERDNISYTKSLKLDLDIQECTAMMTSSWWQISSDSGTPLETVYEVFTARCWFHYLRILIHLPFVLKSFTDFDFNSSTIEALSSARSMISCYRALRDENRPLLRVCNVLNFEVFTAAMIIVLCLLGNFRSYESQQQQDDHELIYSLIDIFRRVAARIPNDVPTQAVHLIESLFTFHENESETNATFQANVPYFGTIMIKKVRESTEEMNAEHTIDVEDSGQLRNSCAWSATPTEWMDGVDFGFQDKWTWDIK